MARNTIWATVRGIDSSNESRQTRSSDTEGGQDALTDVAIERVPEKSDRYTSPLRLVLMLVHMEKLVLEHGWRNEAHRGPGQ